MLSSPMMDLTAHLIYTMNNNKTKVSYIRDKRSPVPKNKNVSVVMSANKAKNTGPELIFRQGLRKVGLIGYRLHWKKAPGRPDIAFTKVVAAAAIDSFLLILLILL